MKPLMELSASLDTYRPNSAALFRSLSANSKTELVNNDGKCAMETITSIFPLSSSLVPTFQKGAFEELIQSIFLLSISSTFRKRKEFGTIFGTGRLELSISGTSERQSKWTE